MSETVHIGDRGELDAQELQVAQLLIAGKKVAEVAREVNLVRTVIYKMLRRPHVKAFLREVRLGQQTAVLTAVQEATEDAMRLLVDAFRNESLPMGQRLRAAERLLANAASFGAMADDQEAIDELRSLVESLSSQVHTM